MIPCHASDYAVRLMTLDPTHFHASLVQKFMYAGVDPVVRVYAPEGPDLEAHLRRIEGFNTRASDPTRWGQRVYRGSDYLDRMIGEKPGNVVVISGNSTHKSEYILRSVSAGLHVFADKPLAITPDAFDSLCRAFAVAEEKGVLLFDMMTERHEITCAVQRELARNPGVFGRLEKGTRRHPAVVMESVHYFLKEVAGKPLIRPAWFFDVRQEGEAIPDVGTHLVDLVQWGCFPDQALDWRKDVRVLSARRWATPLSLAQFQRVTGLADYPEFLRKDVGPDGRLQVFQNGEVRYRLRGVNVQLTALWNFEPSAGARDSHYALLRGTRANLIIKQGPEQQYQPELYVESCSGRADEFERVLRTAIERLGRVWPGLELQREGGLWRVVIPEKHRVGHEAHFAGVTKDFLHYFAEGKLPPWEVPNMLAKYYTTTEAYRLGHMGAARK
jgi:predicted dehydrogenase